jgi:hypothetical protein
VRGGCDLWCVRENGGFDSAPFDPMYGFRNLESIHCVFGKGKGKGEEVGPLGRKALVVEGGCECRGERNCWMDVGYVWQL